MMKGAKKSCRRCISHEVTRRRNMTTMLLMVSSRKAASRASRVRGWLPWVMAVS